MRTYIKVTPIMSSTIHLLILHAPDYKYQLDIFLL